MTITNWNPLPKGSLRGFFDLTLDSGLVLLECSLFEKGEARWVNPPQKSFRSGDKTRYKPLVEFIDRETREKFSLAVLRAFDEQIGGAR